ncbi:lyase [Candidatus Tenderia electrophaga]|jgi:virginiamycin B lyase|uniref:Lyase n=1 Tax=Candidatus Tenderia electrophaga TaxID=1748243 RepID=A0A0S2T9X8_9GAMM|nr:lyase [Candidatus Tenderia electrophaga]
MQTSHVLPGLLFTLLFVLAGATPSHAVEAVEITEWRVPWDNSRPRDPWVGGPGRIWFVGQVGDYVASLNPKTGEFRRYDLEPGTGPHTVIADARGAWYAGNRARHIGLIDPHSGVVDKIMMPGDGRGDVHTMDFTSAGDIWFTVQHGNQIGFLDTETREVTLYPVPTPSARPYGLVVGKDDRPWVALFGTHKLATVSDGEVKEFDLPRQDSRPRRLGLDGDGKVWYVDYAAGYLGRYDPRSDKVEEWRTPAAQHAMPYAMGMDHRGRPWFVETGVQPNRFVGFDPATETFTEPVKIGSGGGTVRHMVFDARRQAFWFGTDTNTIGKAALK